EALLARLEDHKFPVAAALHQDAASAEDVAAFAVRGLVGPEHVAGLGVHAKERSCPTAGQAEKHAVLEHGGVVLAGSLLFLPKLVGGELVARFFHLDRADTAVAPAAAFFAAAAGDGVEDRLPVDDGRPHGRVVVAA